MSDKDMPQKDSASRTSATNQTPEANMTAGYFQSNRPAASFFAALQSLLLRPRDFFADMPFAVFFSNSLFFASIIIFVLTFVAVPVYTLLTLFMLPFTWGVLLIAMLAMASYLSWGVKAFAGSRLTTANAFQLCAYAFAPMMFVGLSWGGIIACLWMLFLLWTGLSAHCRISGGRAAAVLILPLIMLAMLGGSMMFAMDHLRIVS